MAVKFSNNGKTTLASDITNSATSITVNDGSVYPSLSGGDTFFMTLEDPSGNIEIVSVSAVSSNTLTVTRAQEGTTARAFSAGDKAENRLTAAGLNSFVADSGDTMSGNLGVTGNITVTGTVDGRDVATDGSKLDGIAAGATAVSSLTDLSITDGTNGQALKTDGNGNFSFGDVTSSVAFTDITGKPTTLSGYGITDSVAQLSDTSSPNYQTPSSRRVDPNGNNPTNEHYAITTFGNGSNVTGQIAAHFQTGQLYSRGYNSSFSSWRKIWNDANDGSGSGLDADTVDGIQASSFLRSDQSDTMTGTLTFGHATLSHQTDYTWRGLTITNTGDNNECTVDGKSSDGTQQFVVYGGAQESGFLNPTTYGWKFKMPVSGSFTRDNTYTIWDSGNDGAGSGLDADLLDGYHGSFTRTAANTYVLRDSNGYMQVGWINTTSGATTSTVDKIYASNDSYLRYITPATFRAQVISNQTITELYNNAWYRTNGNGGWYNQTHGGGINMQDSTYVRTYGSKQLYVNNHIKSSANVYAYWSDDRLKTKIGNIDNALDKVQSLSGFTYTRNDVAKSHGFDGDEVEVGVSAQEVKAVLPQAIHLAPFDEKVEDDGTIVSESGEDYMTVDYPRLVPLLIEAIKELKAEVNNLQAQVKELQE